jgi:hypothetical protein
MWGESERILSVEKRLAWADVERFKSKVEEGNKSEKHPENWTDSTHVTAREIRSTTSFFHRHLVNWHPFILFSDA